MSLDHRETAFPHLFETFWRGTEFSPQDQLPVPMRVDPFLGRGDVTHPGRSTSSDTIHMPSHALCPSVTESPLRLEVRCRRPQALKPTSHNCTVTTGLSTYTSRSVDILHPPLMENLMPLPASHPEGQSVVAAPGVWSAILRHSHTVDEKCCKGEPCSDQE